MVASALWHRARERTHGSKKQTAMATTALAGEHASLISVGMMAA